MRLADWLKARLAPQDPDGRDERLREIERNRQRQLDLEARLRRVERQARVMRRREQT